MRFEAKMQVLKISAKKCGMMGGMRNGWTLLRISGIATAAANKFLRIYYARVKECLNALDKNNEASGSSSAPSAPIDLP